MNRYPTPPKSETQPTAAAWRRETRACRNVPHANPRYQVVGHLPMIKPSHDALIRSCAPNQLLGLSECGNAEPSKKTSFSAPIHRTRGGIPATRFRGMHTRCGDPPRKSALVHSHVFESDHSLPKMGGRQKRQVFLSGWLPQVE